MFWTCTILPCIYTAIHVKSVCVYMHVCVQVVAVRLVQWLQNVELKRVSDQQTTIRLHCDPDYPTDQALTLLQAQLTVLRAVQVHEQAMPSVRVQLVGWPLTREVMSALQGLPQWPCVLHIRDSQWPLEPDEYRTLAQYIPTR